jgi:hypothetical protein
VADYLAAGAMQLRALSGARTGLAVHAALVSAAGHWVVVTAAITGAVALALACAPGRRRGPRPVDRAGRYLRRHADPGGRGARSITGKLAIEANRIVDRGELSVPR